LQWGKKGHEGKKRRGGLKEQGKQENPGKLQREKKIGVGKKRCDVRASLQKKTNVGPKKEKPGKKGITVKRRLR